MKKFTYLLSALLLVSSFSYAQNTRKAQLAGATPAQLEQQEIQLMQAAPKSPDGHIRCFTSELEQLKRAANPTMETAEQFEEWITQKMKEQANNPSLKASRNIPVVVHVIHNGDAIGSNENISVAQINSQITILNQDFSATNSDISNVPSTFSSAVSNSDIQFCLAQTDPNGNPTTGIDRVQLSAASYNSSSAEAMKPGTSWDPTNYFNIWVVNFGSSGLLGYAQFPSSSGLAGLAANGGAANTDGVVIAHNAFGNTGAAAAPYNKGRTATHEIGHCFGLRHIWGDGTCATDYCNDTPTQQTSNYNCQTHPFNVGGCSGNTTGEMFMNYMDYVPDACMYMFTNNQKARFDAVLLNSPRRASLLTSTVCNAAAITANFTGVPTTINETQTVTFTDASSSPATLNSWAWTFTGGSPASFNGQTPGPITYNTAGTYTVSLTVTDNAAGNDNETKVAYITVNPAGSSTCDSTAANWDWNTESFFTGAYWSASVCTGNDGYIMGNNCYDDNGWASKVTFSGVGKEITDLIYLFDQSTGTGAGSLKVWNANGAGGAPNSVLFNYPITTGQFSANLQQLIFVPVSPTVAVSSNFYIGNDHAVTPINGDTLCMAIATGTTGNQIWAKETTGWKDLSAYSLNYKGTVGVVICDISTGEKEIMGDLKEVLVFPNPSQGTINIALTSKVESTIEVYNVVGKLVYQAKPFNTQLITIDVNNQPNGVYFVNIKTGNDIVTKKIVLSK